MTDSNYGEPILNVIDHLRKRKARPNLGRIYRALARKHGLSTQEIESELNRLLREGKVVKVEYKGSVSYRNAAKWSRPNFMMQTPGDGQQNNNFFTVFPPSENAENCYSVLSYGTENKIVIRGCANSANLAEGLLQARSSSQQAAKVTEDAPIFVESRTGNLGAAPVAKISMKSSFKKKRRKKAVKIKRSYSPVVQIIPTEPDQPARCDFCLSTSACNKYGLAEDLLICKDCGAKAHPTCMDYGQELAARSRLYPWQCISCKMCSICGGVCDPELMLFCDSCDKGYHMNCHQPVIIRKPMGKWKCQSCVAEEMSEVPTDSMNLNTSTCFIRVLGDFNNSLNVIDEMKSSQKFLNRYPENVPIASNWTIADVEHFISNLGFPDQAVAFREQEIDGKSLLLMKRNDVLTGLSIKLGPALKIYNHIKRLQMGKIAS